MLLLAMLCNEQKKYICTDTGAGYNGKMFSMVAKNLDLGAKYSWVQEIWRDKNQTTLMKKMVLKLFR